MLQITDDACLGEIHLYKYFAKARLIRIYLNKLEAKDLLGDRKWSK